MGAPRVDIFILNYNGAGCLLECLHSIFALKYTNRRVFLIDNGSVDGSFENACREYPQCIPLKNEKNKGFSGGMNVGLRRFLQEGSSYAWLINFDARVDAKSLGILVEWCEKEKEIGLASPIIFENEDRVWFSGGKIDFFRMRTVHKKERWTEDFFQSEYLTGCALFLRKELIQSIGLLDERFFLYYEDADYSLRAVQSGWKLGVSAAARVFHGERSSEYNKQKIYYLVLSGLLFFEKHARGWQRCWVTVFNSFRKINNKLQRSKGKKEAFEVYRAYVEFERIRK